MDATLRSITDYAVSVSFADLSADRVNSVNRHHLDAVGCAAGAFAADGDITDMLHRFACGATVTNGASVFGCPSPVVFEDAVFANSAMVRYLDYSDVYFGSAGGQVSAVAPAVIAAAEMHGLSGRRAVAAIFVAYEVWAAISDAVGVADPSWDLGLVGSIATAAALGNLLGLGADVVANAVALAAVANVPLRVTRTGELSNWKGCALPYSARVATTAVRLAAEGMTAPARPFEGRFGVFEVVTGPLDLSAIGALVGGQSAVERTWFKWIPAVVHTQGPVQLAVELRQSASIDEIESIELTTYPQAYRHCGGGHGDHAEKWDPQTRETADHSIAYLMAVALVDGRVDLDAFRAERVSDPALRPLMKAITVRPFEGEPDPQRPKCTIRAVLRGGRVFQRELEYPRGHPENPMTDQELLGKFQRLAGGVVPDGDLDRFVDGLLSLERLANVAEITSVMRGFRRGQNGG